MFRPQYQGLRSQPNTGGSAVGQQVGFEGNSLYHGEQNCHVKEKKSITCRNETMSAIEARSSTTDESLFSTMGLTTAEVYTRQRPHGLR
jgi:hypothetical protein